MTKRMWKATKLVRAISMKKAPFSTKVQVIRAKALTMALYGCESGPLPQGSVDLYLPLAEAGKRRTFHKL